MMSLSPELQTGCGVEDIDRCTVGDVWWERRGADSDIYCHESTSSCTTSTGVARPLRNQKFESPVVTTASFLVVCLFLLPFKKSTWSNLLGHATYRIQDMSRLRVVTSVAPSCVHIGFSFSKKQTQKNATQKGR